MHYPKWVPSLERLIPAQILVRCKPANEANATGEENQNFSDARMNSEDVDTTSTNRVLDTWQNIQRTEMKEDELIGKVKAKLDSIESVVFGHVTFRSALKRTCRK